MKKSVKKKASLFCSDYFFHYLMHHSHEFRRRLCMYLTGDEINSTEVTYNDVYGSNKDSRKMILDIVVKDDQDRYYNFEMQNGCINEGTLVRFQLYAMSLVSRQMIELNNYKEVKKVRQLIVYTGPLIKNFEHDYHIAQLYDKDYQVLMERGLLEFHILQIQRLEEMKMDVRYRDIQEVFWMFSDEMNHKKKAKTELGKDIKALYDRYLHSEDFMIYCHIERERRVIEQGMRNSKEEGEKIGFDKGKIEEIKKIIYAKYGIHELEWLNDCTEAQLDRIHMIIFENISYEEFKEKIIE
ncbi:PD-(D/E)XK nuclease family transposase [Candidatus Stoquefichus massiliensis]|uniref:PD-(D/E)XK nuclease family transposase n=1 Tax=Candidatus Stoquefichus massiliensis TaxID=1470350 RepID=UPI0009DB8D3F|nr:PD-(D/E)XK nuclease family transposase [Candidatus Stoquefichus massiliensis]